MSRSGAKVCCIFFAILTGVLIAVTVLLYPHRENTEEKAVKAVETYVSDIDSFRKKPVGGGTTTAAHNYNRISLDYDGQSYDVEVQAESGFATKCRYAYDMHTMVTAYLYEGKMYATQEEAYRNPEASGRYYGFMAVTAVCFCLMAVSAGVYIDKRRKSKGRDIYG